MNRSLSSFQSCLLTLVLLWTVWEDAPMTCSAGFITTTPCRITGTSLGYFSPRQEEGEDKSAQRPATSTKNVQGAAWRGEMIPSPPNKGADIKRVQTWLQEDEPSKVASNMDHWQVALAGSLVCGGACEWLTHSSLLSVTAFVAIFIAAVRDPLDEEEDAVAGPMARIIGRSAIQSYQVSKPKLKAVARAAIQSEDAVLELQRQVQELREDNYQLQLYKERREWIDQEYSNYNMEELKVLAQRYQVPYSGVTKSQLMMRLLQVGALKLVVLNKSE